MSGRATGCGRRSLSRRDPARFWRDVLLNGTQIEALWRARGCLAADQRAALADIYNGAAHGLFRARDPGFRDALASLRESGLPIGWRNRVAELVTDVSGQRAAVRLAELWTTVAPVAAGRRPDRCEAAHGTCRLAVCRVLRTSRSRSSAAGQFSRPAVLHVPFTYFPDEVGGTEIHVAALIRALQVRGIEGAVAAPGDRDQAYGHAGVPVYRLATASRPDLAHAYGAPDRQVAHSFGTLLARLRPRIVHLHARTAAVSEALADAAHAAGAKVVFTYHTPTVSCVRGAMMRMGRVPCDGRLDRRRCSICVLDAHGMPPLLRDAVACAPDAVRRLGRTLRPGRARGNRPALTGSGRRVASGLPRADGQRRARRRGLSLGARRAPVERRSGRQARALPPGFAVVRRSGNGTSPGRARRAGT